MNKQFYEYIYKITKDVTPLPVDCGKLCDGACCKGDSDMGMYLFPGENVMFSPAEKWTNIKKSGFTYGNNRALFFGCDGSCDRAMRPLACRIFPLFPYVDITGNLEIIMDPRAKSLCPLAMALDISELDPHFLRTMSYVLKLMSKNSVIFSYMFEVSRFVDETKSFLEKLSY